MHASPRAHPTGGAEKGLRGWFARWPREAVRLCASSRGGVEGGLIRIESGDAHPDGDGAGKSEGYTPATARRLRIQEGNLEPWRERAAAPSAETAGGGGCTHNVMHGQSRLAIDRRIPAMPGRSLSDFSPTRQTLFVAPSAKRRKMIWAS